MKNVQFTQTEVDMIVNALASEITAEVVHSKPNYELIGKLTAIKHKIVHSPSHEMGYASKLSTVLNDVTGIEA